MLRLRSIGLSEYAVLESGQRIGRIRLATEHMPCVWLWSVIIHLTGGLPMGSAKDLDTAKGAAGGSLQGDENSGRWLKDGPPPSSNIDDAQ